MRITNYKKIEINAPLRKEKKYKLKKKKNNSRIIKYANRLNENLPRSEIWFDGLFKSHYLYDKFRKNQIIGNYIVDLLCIDNKIVIEIDGSYHERKDQKIKDWYKEQNLKKKGYTVIRVLDNNIESYNNCIKMLESLYVTV
jgi:very-short-patch-repair endonuclease